MAKQPLGGERWGEEVSVGQSKQSASTNSSLLLLPNGLFLLRAPLTPYPKFDHDTYSAQTTTGLSHVFLVWGLLGTVTNPDKKWQRFPFMSP